MAASPDALPPDLNEPVRPFSSTGPDFVDGLLGPAPTMRLTRWFYLRGLALIYLIAFASFGVQARGLIGSQGILPLREYFELAEGAFGPSAFWVLPGVFWLDTSDAFISGVCIAGVILAALMLVGFAQRYILIILYVLYLSLVSAGQDFMAFQWDILLLETGFLAIFLAPPNLLPRPPAQEQPPLMAPIWLARWLLFRLMLGSGIVKLASGDPNWRNLTAMAYHYETQPLPNPLAWYAYHLPMWADKAATLGTFFMELIVPFLYFTPRKIRRIGALLTVLLQLFIILTGNFNFFNWLTIVLCILLLDDKLLYRFTSRVPYLRGAPPGRWPSIPWRTVAYAFSALILALSIVIFPLRLLGVRQIPDPMRVLLRTAGPFFIVNSYGLFAVMTTERPEIIVEGSMDGETWEAYEFRYKPDNLDEGLPIVAPHQPRLDWQMWFAALQGRGGPPWFQNFMFRLLQGSPDVLALLDDNPFPDAPPRYVRARVYDYEFTDFATRRDTGRVWQRGGGALYFPEVSLREPPSP